MCNAPKFGEIEERTGYGGGYNDRGVVEYIKRDDSDSEYDEVSNFFEFLESLISVEPYWGVLKVSLTLNFDIIL